MSQELTSNEIKRAELLLKFIEIAKEGIVKPYDPSQIIKKLESVERGLADPDKELLREIISKYLPPVGIVRDALDFRPYIIGAAREFARVMNIDITYNRR